MTTLIAILISLLGYGSPSDYSDYSEDQLNEEIAQAEADAALSEDDGIGGDWDSPGVVNP